MISSNVSSSACAGWDTNAGASSISGVMCDARFAILSSMMVGFTYVGSDIYRRAGGDILADSSPVTTGRGTDLDEADCCRL